MLCQMGALISVLWRAVAALVMLVGIGTLAGCGPDSLSGATMGTRYRVLGEACPDGLPEVRVAAALDEVVQDMSTWVPDSSLSRFNRAPPGKWFGVSADMVRVVAAAAMVSDSTEGAFDVTVAPLVDEYGFGPGSVLADEAVHVDYRFARVAGASPGLAQGRAVAGGPFVNCQGICGGSGCGTARRRRLHVCARRDRWRVASLRCRTRRRRVGESPSSPPATDSLPACSLWTEGGIATSGDYRQTGERDGTRTTHIIDASHRHAHRRLPGVGNRDCSHRHAGRRTGDSA